MRFWTRSGYIDLPPVFPPDTAGAGGQLRLSARVEQSPDARTPRRMQRVGRLHWSGAGGSCRVSRPSAGPCGVVVGDPGGNQAAGIGQAAEQRLGKSSRLRPPKLSTKPFRIDLPGAMSCHSALCSAHDWRMAFEVQCAPVRSSATRLADYKPVETGERRGRAAHEADQRLSVSRDSIGEAPFKLMMSAQRKRRKLDGRNHVVDIVRGVEFRGGQVAA